MTATPDDRVSNDRFLTPADAALALGPAGLEHDFRNLLQCGVSALRLLLTALETRKTEQELHSMAWIARDGSFALEKASDLARQVATRTFARRAASEVDVNQLFGSLRGTLELAAGGNIRLAVRLAPQLPAIHCDPLELENVILNLVVNCRQAIVHRGSILISAETVEDNGRQYLRVAVTDTGPGVSRGTLRLLSHSACSTKAEGSGFGLARARAFAESLGGRLRLENAPFVGACASLDFPILPRGLRGIC